MWASWGSVCVNAGAVWVSAVLVGVSALTPAPSAEQVSGLTYATSERVAAPRADLAWTAGLIGGVAATWLYFS